MICKVESLTMSILFLFFLIFSRIDGYIHTNDVIMILPGGTFMNRVYFDEGAIPTSCKVIYEDEETSRTGSMVLPLDERFVSEDPIFKDRISNLERGICGFKTVNLTKDDPTKFSINVTYTQWGEDLEERSLPFQVIFYDYGETLDTVKAVTIGSSINIDCGLKNKQRACIVHNPRGEIVQADKNCMYGIPIIRPEDLGRWTCSAGMTSSMAQVDECIDLVNDDKTNERIVTWYTETGDIGRVGCEYLDYKISREVGECFMIKPDEETLVLKQGTTTARYNTTRLRLNQQQIFCELEIPLPLLQSEIGTWQCGFLNTGSFINVKQSSNLSYPVYYHRTAQMNYDFEITCRILRPADYCYITSPTGLAYSGGIYSDFLFGKCSTRIIPRSVDDAGNWTCHYSTNTYEEELIVVEVSIDRTLESAIPHIYVQESDHAEIICKSTSVIHYCRFVDPHNNTYHVSPDKQSEHYKYVGRGFNSGDCGIRIEKVKSSDAGVWRCYVRSGEELPQNTDKFEKELMAETEISISSRNVVTAGVGILLGIASVAVLILLGGIYYACRKKSREVPRNSETDSTDSGNVATMVE